MTTPTPTLRIDRTGKVWRGDRLLGYVDRYERMGSRQPVQTWRWVNLGGHTSPGRYPTRAAAVDALAGAA
jgi:hypothetical protein